MNKYIDQYYKIMNEQIKKSFPKLKDKKIIIEEKEAQYRAKVEHYHWGFKIIMATKLRKFPKSSWKRILIHELCHLETFLNQSWIVTNMQFIFYYKLFPWLSQRKEKEANILMIKKGYGNLVLTVRKGNIRRGLPYSLTEKEIKSYIKQYKQK